MKVERFESSLQPRIWSINRGSGGTGHHLVLFNDGSGEAETGAERHYAAAPAFLWIGGMNPGRLRVEAGATGYHAVVAESTLLAALGDQPEGGGLRNLMERRFVLSLSGQEEAERMMETSLAAALSEVRQPQEAAALLMSALLRIVLVAVIRVSGGEASAIAGSGAKAGLLQRFRQLVEINFRSHWTVARYAAALGISSDRLHAICTSGIGKSPKALIGERLAHEAALRLERSPLTIQQLGHSLGFNDAAHFSNFFRKMTGMPPGRYRKIATSKRTDGDEAPAPGFADWP